MDDWDTPPPAVSDAALLRYSIVAQVESLVLAGWPAAAAVRRVAAEPHAAPDRQPERVSVRTLQRWRAAYAADGIEALARRSSIAGYRRVAQVHKIVAA